MNVKSRYFAILWLFLLSVAGWAAPTAIGQELTTEQMRSDLEALAKELPLRHADGFATLDRAAFDRQVSDLDARLESLTPDAFCWELNRLLVGLGDAHTLLAPLPAGQHYLPINFKALDDGIFVRAIDREHQELLQGKLVSLGGIPADQILERMAKWIPHDNQQGLQVAIDQRLNHAQLLKALGGQPVNGGWQVVCQPGNQTQAITLAEIPLAEVRSIQFAVAPNCMTYARSKPLDHWNDWLANDKAVYFQYRKCRNATGLNRLIAGTKGFIAQQDVEFMVVDLRENTGGDSRLLNPLIDYLSEHPRFSQPGGLYVLIGRQTFSSAILNAIDLQRRCRAILVGEATQGKPNHFGEVRQWALPTSGWTLFYSTKRFEMDPEGDPDAVEPQIRVTLDQAKWFGESDPALEAVRRDRKRRQAGN